MVQEIQAIGFIFWHVLACIDDVEAGFVIIAMNLLCLSGVFYCGGLACHRAQLRRRQRNTKWYEPIGQYSLRPVWQRPLCGHARVVVGHVRQSVILEINQS